MKCKLYKVEYENYELGTQNDGLAIVPSFSHSKYLILESENQDTAEKEAEQELLEDLSRQDNPNNKHLIIHSTSLMFRTSLSRFIDTYLG
jgi:hypothetical protein